MKKNLLLTAALLLTASATWSQTVRTVLQTSKNNEVIEPARFKTSIPFDFTEGGSIILKTMWGKEHQPVMLKFDNAAPTAVDSLTRTTLAGVQETGEQDKDRLMPTGQKITSHFLLTDHVQLGDINVKQVAFLEVPFAQRPAQGLLGRNIIKKGIWKIDFENKVISFTNSLDSIGGPGKARELPVKFDYFDRITVKMKMEKTVTDVFEVDLGYNGAVTLPYDKFRKVAKDSYVRKAPGTVSTAAGAAETNFYVLKHGVLSFKEDTYLDFDITSSDLIKDKLLGLGFFSQFKFVIIDYINKSLYISSEKVASYYKTKL